jgi:hypothetical protein
VGWIVPISLLTCITQTRRISSGRSCAGLHRPSPVTSSWWPRPALSAVSITAACSIAEYATEPPCPLPRIARLIASVALPVKITRPPGGSSAATCSRASSTAAAAIRPIRCAECGLPNPSLPGPPSQRTIASRASGASGVVAW